ncbi:MAG: helicase RepA family protein [Acutalibacteraceae bacterium]|nr:helicase RepA family protein [Acutalibacteraceae bacterium]
MNEKYDLCDIDESYLHTVSMTELFDSAYQSKPPIIDGLLYRGTYLFAGSPKIGKSFLMAQLAYHVSTGINLWGFDVRQGKVLYLALEDNYPRLQKRLYRMFGTAENENLFFSVSAHQLDNGLDEQLDGFLQKHPDTSLVIIDTLQKVREVGGENYSYANDYQIITKLKSFTDNHNICMLVVHHTRKQTADDKFDMISGTNGLLGAADGGFVLSKDKRTSNNATLEVSGRDQQDQRVYLKKNTETLVWELDKIETELWKAPPEPLLERIAERVTADNPQWCGTPTELCEYLTVDIKPNAITQKLNVNVNRLMDEHKIVYHYKRTHEGRRITLTYEGSVSKRDSCDSDCGVSETPTQLTRTDTH